MPKKKKTLERDFQKSFIKKVKTLFKGCIVLKNDSGYLQGIPDWIVLFKDKWALLEMKKSSKANKQPNQEYYVELADKMSFARFVYPENSDSVIEELTNFFGAAGGGAE